jgi:hypothetical protein
VPRSPLPPSPAAVARHASADAAGHDGYIDPDTGYFVMTAGSLRRRGYCCGNGCRHCPWPPEEQRRAGRPGS